MKLARKPATQAIQYALPVTGEYANTGLFRWVKYATRTLSANGQLVTGVATPLNPDGQGMNNGPA